jgi:hypothetical protein
MSPWSGARSPLLVSVLFEAADLPGVRSLSEGVAPDQDVAFLLLAEANGDELVQTAEFRSRAVSKSKMAVVDRVVRGAFS